MNWMAFYIAAAIVAALVAAIGIQTHRLKAEQASHALTRKELAEAVERGAGWKRLYETAQASAQAQQEAVQECLDREVLAARAREERADILRNARARPRTEAEKHEVVDNETRRAAADRLNRSF